MVVWNNFHPARPSSALPSEVRKGANKEDLVPTSAYHFRFSLKLLRLSEYYHRR